MLDTAQVRKYLAEIAHIKQAHVLVDVHVHPFEVIFNGLKYRKNTADGMVYSQNESKYDPPEIAAVKSFVAPSARCRDLVNENVRKKYMMSSLGKLYLHTGRQVFLDQMVLSGIDRALLLPVSSPGTANDEQMKLLAAMFADDSRFILGYAVAKNVGNDRIAETIAYAAAKYPIKAIKIHPAISGINVCERHDLEHVECILSACRGHDLRVVVHGGRSPDVKTRETVAYGELDRLERVDWSLAGNPVVIAHAGVYGLDEGEAGSCLETLKRIMVRHDNVLVDISGLSHALLCLALTRLDPQRILFGSDAIYYPQWRAIVTLYHALKQTTSKADELFVMIASTNPVNFIAAMAAVAHEENASNVCKQPGIDGGEHV